MDAERVRSGIVREDSRGPVSLVHVEIHYENAVHRAARQDAFRGDGEIVEDAKTASVVAMRVVRAARRVDGDSGGERQVGGEYGAGDLGEGSLDEVIAPGKPDLAQRGVVEGAYAERVDVVLAVRGGEFLLGGHARGLEQILARDGDAVRDESAVDGAEHGHGEAVVLGHDRFGVRGVVHYRKAMVAGTDPRAVPGPALDALAVAVAVLVMVGREGYRVRTRGKRRGVRGETAGSADLTGGERAPRGRGRRRQEHSRRRVHRPVRAVRPDRQP